MEVSIEKTGGMIFCDNILYSRNSPIFVYCNSYLIKIFLAVNKCIFATSFTLVITSNHSYW